VVLCEVLRGTGVDSLQTFFRGAGYIFYRVTSNGPVAEEILSGGLAEQDWNYLFMPGEKASELQQL